MSSKSHTINVVFEQTAILVAIEFIGMGYTKPIQYTVAVQEQEHIIEYTNAFAECIKIQHFDLFDKITKLFRIFMQNAHDKHTFINVVNNSPTYSPYSCSNIPVFKTTRKPSPSSVKNQWQGVTKEHDINIIFCGHTIDISIKYLNSCYNKPFLYEISSEKQEDIIEYTNVLSIAINNKLDYICTSIVAILISYLQTINAHHALIDAVSNIPVIYNDSDNIDSDSIDSDEDVVIASSE